MKYQLTKAETIKIIYSAKCRKMEIERKIAQIKEIGLPDETQAAYDVLLWRLKQTNSVINILTKSIGE